MDHEIASRIINQQIEVCADMLVTKAGEYADDVDRLVNFRTGADLQGIPMRKTLAGYMAKHTVSVYDMLWSDKEFSREKWDEKITDHINYLLLLQCVLEDERSELTVAAISEELLSDAVGLNEKIWLIMPGWLCGTCSKPYNEHAAINANGFGRDCSGRVVSYKDEPGGFSLGLTS